MKKNVAQSTSPRKKSPQEICFEAINAVTSVDDVNNLLNDFGCSAAGEGARTKVYGIANQGIVVKYMAGAEHLLAKFQGWGINLGEVQWFDPSENTHTELGNANLLVQKSVKSFDDAKKIDPRAVAKFVCVKGDGELRFTPTEGGEFAVKPNIQNSTGGLDVVVIVQERVPLFQSILKAIKESPDEPGWDKNKDVEALFEKWHQTIFLLWGSGVSEDVYNFMDNYGLRQNPGGQIDLVLVDLGEITPTKWEVETFALPGPKPIQESSFKDLTTYDGELSKLFEGVSRNRFTQDNLDKFWGNPTEVDKYIESNPANFSDRFYQIVDDATRF